MMNSSNGMMSPSSSGTAQSPGLKTYFKTPEGRYKLQYEKTHPSGLLHYAHGKTVTQVTLAHLKDKPAPSTPTASSSSFSASSGVRSAAARLLGGSNGSRALSFVGGNGGSKSNGGTSRIGSIGASSSSSSLANPNFDGKGTYLIFNVGDAIFISDLNSQDKDPIKSIHFSNSNPVCHAFDPDAKDGHDLLVGLTSGDVYSVSLRQQLQDVGKKLVGAQHYNKDGTVSNRQGLILYDVFSINTSSNILSKAKVLIFMSTLLAVSSSVGLIMIWNHARHEHLLLSFNGENVLFCYHTVCRCTCIAWVPGGDGVFVVAHADGNLFVYDKNKDSAGDSSFPVVKDQTQFSVVHARYSKSNPIARWHICQGSINMFSFSSDGAYLATVGRDGYLRVFDYIKEQLICGGKSYYGALLCCAWR
ncbi:hypothetical protein Ahy_B06g082320 isoform B [Arachis hypogaea]|uniref:Catabolite repression protein creC n=1 Tax=Arachis hypogaea TaxID=3818 RepID=A0A444YN74_ARAHY|nr:hypothetical protein Ahy_B06g082320 isoform B [Arachis hypogaea]